MNYISFDFGQYLESNELKDCPISNVEESEGRERYKRKIMSWLFGRKKTPEEMLKQNQRALNRAIRDLDKERMKLERQEKQIIGDIKKMAKQGEMSAVKVMAKDLVRTRRYVKKFIMMKANIQAVSLKITTLKSQGAMANAMKGVTKAMGAMNKQINMPQMQKIMMEFEKEADMMDMKEDMMNDIVDDVMGAEEDEEESDQLVNQVLDELGLSLGEELGAVPVATGSVGGKEKASAKQDADDELQARLDNLRRD